MRTHKNFLFVGALAFLLGVQGTGLEDVFTVPVAHAAGMIDTAPLMEGVTVFLGFMITAMNVLMWVLFRLLDLVLDPNLMQHVEERSVGSAGIEVEDEDWVEGAVMTIIKAD